MNKPVRCRLCPRKLPATCWLQLERMLEASTPVVLTMAKHPRVLWYAKVLYCLLPVLPKFKLFTIILFVRWSWLWWADFSWYNRAWWKWRIRRNATFEPICWSKVLFKLSLQHFFLFLKFLKTLDLPVAMTIPQISLDVDSTRVCVQNNGHSFR